MKKYMKFGKKALVAAFACGALLWGNAAAAEQAPAMDGMAAFREAITTPSKPDRRIFREDLLFFSPSLRANVEFLGLARKHSLCLSGNLDVLATDDKGDTAKLDIPFYMTQTNKSMTIYFKLGDTWKKFTTPTLAAVAADVVATPTEEEIEETISLVKEVTVLRETPAQRTMLVHLDSNKLADTIKKYGAQHPADNGTANDGEMQKQFMGYLDQGIRNAGLWYIWTIDKTDWQTITMSYNLSPIVQETARAALRDEHPDWPPMLTEMVETLAYYSDFKTYTTFLNPDVQDKADVPEEVWKNAVPVDDMVKVPEKQAEK